MRVTAWQTEIILILSLDLQSHATRNRQHQSSVGGGRDRLSTRLRRERPGLIFPLHQLGIFHDDSI